LISYFEDSTLCQNTSKIKELIAYYTNNMRIIRNYFWSMKELSVLSVLWGMFKTLATKIKLVILVFILYPFFLLMS